MSSSLTAALLGLEGDSRDPRYGPARRKQAQAAGFYKTASDTSPAASPFAALARALTAIPGGVLDYYGSQEASAITDADKAGSDKILQELRSNPVSSWGSSMPPQTQVDTPPAAAPAAPITGGGAPISSRADLEPIVTEAAARHGLPPELAKALFQQESSFGTNPAAKGNIGQVIASTAEKPGYGMEPISPADLTDPTKNVDFSLRYLKSRGAEAGVTDWKDPKQWAVALKAYNGGGDPQYVEHVAQYLPTGTALRTGGTDMAGPGVPQGQGAQPPGQQPPQGQQQPGGVPSRAQAAMSMIMRAQAALTGIDPHNAYYPQVKAAAEAQIEQGKLLLGISQQEQTRADAERTRTENRAQHVEDLAETRRLATENRTPQTITMIDPGGKGVGIYERTPTGVGKRLGDAPKQPGEGTGPFGGNAMDAQTNNMLLELGPKVSDGTANERERSQYGLAYRHLTQDRIVYIPDPTDPTGQRQVLSRIPGTPLGPEFPPPGGAATASAPAVPGGGASPAPGGATPPPPNGAPVPIPGTTKAVVTTDTEKIAAGYAVRMREAAKTLNDLEDKGVHTGNTGQAIAGGVPLVGNYLTSPDYQVYRQQMADWVRAKLRRESGAVIGKDEMADEIRTYFPEPGDSPEKIAAKRRSRENAQLGMEESGGRAKIEAPPAAPAKADPTALREVQTPDEAQALPPGTRYRTPDGRTFTR